MRRGAALMPVAVPNAMGPNFGVNSSAMRIASFFLPLSRAASPLAAVGDRFGLWRKPGASGVSWFDRSIRPGDVPATARQLDDAKALESYLLTGIVFGPLSGLIPSPVAFCVKCMVILGPVGMTTANKSRSLGTTIKADEPLNKHRKNTKSRMNRSSSGTQI